MAKVLLIPICASLMEDTARMARNLEAHGHSVYTVGCFLNSRDTSFDLLKFDCELGFERFVEINALTKFADYAVFVCSVDALRSVNISLFRDLYRTFEIRFAIVAQKSYMYRNITFETEDSLFEDEALNGRLLVAYTDRYIVYENANDIKQKSHLQMVQKNLIGGIKFDKHRIFHSTTVDAVCSSLREYFDRPDRDDTIRQFVGHTGFGEEDGR